MSATNAKTAIQQLVEDSRYIQAFDIALAAHIDPNEPKYWRENDYKKYIQMLMLAIGGIDWQDIAGDSLLADDCLDYLTDLAGSGDHSAVSACLLKLVAVPEIEWLRTGKWRPKTVDYLRAHLDTDYLLKQRKIDFREQNHIVIGHLEQLVRDMEQSLGQAIEFLTSLEKLSSHKNKLWQAIKRPDSSALYKPFLPAEFEGILSESYSAVELYLDQRESSDALDFYERAYDRIATFIECLETYNTSYSKQIADKLGYHLLQLLERDFEGNSAALPASVAVYARDKKYPFHTAGITTNIGLSVVNSGSGFAHYAEVQVRIQDDSIRLVHDVHTISPGRLLPGETVNLEIPVEVVVPVAGTDVICEVTWTDFDRSMKSHTASFALHAQQGVVDWDLLVRQDPYSLEPVETEHDLVGRKDLLNRLSGTFDSRTVGSAIIRGQKRVGKTSIAKTLGNELSKRNFGIVFLEQGDYIDPDPRKTVALLGEKLCRKLQRQDSRLAHLTLPSFTDALAPMTDFLDDVLVILGDRRILFILDEFDEMSPELYLRGEISDALFMTLRSLSSRNTIGFLLVGGEKMDHIVNAQGVKLNKWKNERVDYFSRETEWSDYRELIERPVGGNLEFSNDAIEHLYWHTAGNPFFTKQLCGYILRIAADRRDCYVTRDEVETAVEYAVQELSASVFQHFWHDGIIESGDVYLEKSTRRTKILLATAIAIDERPDVDAAELDEIRNSAVVRDVPYIENELREFVTRQVLNQNAHVSSYSFKVQLFFRWLQRRGINELISMLPDASLAIHGLQTSELLRVKASEIVDLVDKWGNYRGQPLTTDRVRAWLEQFGGPKEQRLMFKLLQGMSFYSDAYLRHKMQEVHEIVRQGLQRSLRRDNRATKYSEILVSYLDGPDKSGAKLARLYADEAGVYVGNVIERSEIESRLASDSNIQALVFVDDLVATGNSVRMYLHELLSRLGPILETREQPLKIVFTAIVAHVNGWSEIQNSIGESAIEVEAHVCELIDESHQCFCEKSSIFPDPVDREAARAIALDVGQKLEKRTPLGYGDLGLAIAFSDNCPNNTLPILRAQSSGQFQWKPLFRRS